MERYPNGHIFRYTSRGRKAFFKPSKLPNFASSYIRTFLELKKRFITEKLETLEIDLMNMIVNITFFFVFLLKVLKTI